MCIKLKTMIMLSLWFLQISIIEMTRFISIEFYSLNVTTLHSKNIIPLYLKKTLNLSKFHLKKTESKCKWRIVRMYRNHFRSSSKHLQMYNDSPPTVLSLTQILKNLKHFHLSFKTATPIEGSWCGFFFNFYGSNKKMLLVQSPWDAARAS